MSIRIRLTDLDTWWRAAVDNEALISVAGEFRLKGHQQPLELLELGGKYAHTAKISIPLRPPIRQGGNPPTSCFVVGGDWWNSWSPVLAAAGLMSPGIDPVRLLDLLHDTRRIRFCCDTNALAGGVVSWLLMVLGDRIDLVTSAVVDRELAAWPDRVGHRFWNSKDVESWELRTQYRLARRTIECPPEGVVVDRLSPEQGALMLAKFRDEQKTKKSPDADVLLVEVARSLVREQSRNARTVFLTGDRNNARTATGALGAENVLYAVADKDSAKALQGKIVARGFYRPDGPLGALNMPPIRSLLWNLLAACDRLTIRQRTQSWYITSCSTIPRGAPSDWADPWVEIEELRSNVSSPVITIPTPPTASAPTSPESPTSNEIPNEGSLDSPAVETNHAKQVEAPVTTNASKPETLRAEEPTLVVSAPTTSTIATIGSSNEWLLPPRKVELLVDVPVGARPLTGMIFPLLLAAFGVQGSITISGSKETKREALQILSKLGATDGEGTPGPRLQEFRSAWDSDDLDWFHAEMLRVPGYSFVLNLLRQNGGASLTARQEAHRSMARSLGQVARVKQGDPLIVGDAPLKTLELSSALERWFPNVGMTRGTEELCLLAADELKLTPLRFERAMEKLWERGLGKHYQGEHGGIADSKMSERIVIMGKPEFKFRDVAPGDLSFGRRGPVRFIKRTG